MQIRKQEERVLQTNADGEAYVLWGKQQVPISAFYREPVRFVDWERTYWHAMDCTRDLVIHLDRDNEHYILGKVSAP